MAVIVLVIGGILLVALIAVGGYVAFRQSKRVAGKEPVNQVSELDALDLNMAKGEMTGAEYQEQRANMQHTDDQSSPIK